VKFGDKVLDLLNRTEKNPVVVDFFDSMKPHGLIVEKFSEVLQRKSSSFNTYRIPKFGLSIHANDERLVVAHFTMQPQRPNEGTYAEALPLGLPGECSRTDVHNTLGQPTEVTDAAGGPGRDHFRVGPWRIMCSYSPNSMKLASLKISCPEALTGSPKN
jgi:hypothetical protein